MWREDYQIFQPSRQTIDVKRPANRIADECNV